MLKLDLYDLKILDILQHEGRLGNNELAERIALSPSACLRRVRNLEVEGVISGYGARLDQKMFGFNLEAFVSVILRKESDGWHERFNVALESWPEVINAYVVTGETQYMLHVITRSMEDFSDFIINRLYKKTSIIDIRSNIVLQKVKTAEKSSLSATMRELILNNKNA